MEIYSDCIFINNLISIDIKIVKSMFEFVVLQISTELFYGIFKI